MVQRVFNEYNLMNFDNSKTLGQILTGLG
jgi:hypothetical protein